MNGHETDILKGIREEIASTRKEILEDIKETQTRLNDLRAEHAETKSDVKNLVGWVGGVNERLEAWATNGCPVGNVRYENMEKQLKDVKNELKDDINDVKTDLSNTKKDVDKNKHTKRTSVLAAAGAGAGISAVIHAILAVVTVNGAQAIEARWSIDNGAGGAPAGNITSTPRSLIALACTRGA